MVKLEPKVLGERLLAEPRRDFAMRWSLVALFGAGGLISLATLPVSTYLSASERAVELAACLVALR